MTYFYARKARSFLVRGQLHRIKVVQLETDGSFEDAVAETSKHCLEMTIQLTVYVVGSQARRN